MPPTQGKFASCRLRRTDCRLREKAMDTMNITLEVLRAFWESTDQYIARWANWVSVASLLGVIYSYVKLNQIQKIVEHEHDRVLEAMKPFDLFDAIRKLRKTLEADRHTKKKIAILKSLDDFSERLRSYFRQIHGLSGDTDNMYLEMGHCLLQKNRTEEALEHFRKALDVAKEKDDRDEEIECLAGLRECHALEVHVNDFYRTDEEFEKHYPPVHLTLRQRIVVARKRSEEHTSELQSR